MKKVNLIYLASRCKDDVLTQTLLLSFFTNFSVKESIVYIYIAACTCNTNFVLYVEFIDKSHLNIFF